MADLCNDLIRGMTPNCQALNKVGGVDPTVFIAKKEWFTYATDSNGYVNSVSMATNGSVPYKLLKYTTEDYKNNANWPLTAGDNVNTFNHNVVLPLKYSTPTELDTLEKLSQVRDLVVFIVGNDDKVLILGLDKGLKMSAAEGGTGVLLNDSTAYTVTLSGEQRTLPKYFSINGTVATIAQNLAYLDALA